MFTATTALLIAVCGIVITFGCWWPPREPKLTVATVQRRLAFESYCRKLETRWPARVEAELDRELVLARLHAVMPSAPAATPGTTRATYAANRAVRLEY
ncbi:hypothetical protein [Nocardia vermiculata]|uniref:Uncharacterized protein n=1 Tax=Nocardia vermiculata TaxID=257274 RepID=A0A846Y331_9NOCA|nr:hypothetical protein [Nocardia vermiculata]NKY52360.1 hypothetical protein [Nocardia vermiculata]